MKKTKIYSPLQVAFCTSYGGPLAAVYALAKNFRALGDRDAMRRMWIVGGVLTLALIGALPFLPDMFPPILLPVMYTSWAWRVASQDQMKRADIAASDEYQVQPIGNVVLVGIAGLVVGGSLFAAWFYALAMMGWATITD